MAKAGALPFPPSAMAPVIQIDEVRAALGAEEGESNVALLTGGSIDRKRLSAVLDDD